METNPYRSKRLKEIIIHHKLQNQLSKHIEHIISILVSNEDTFFFSEELLRAILCFV